MTDRNRSNVASDPIPFHSSPHTYHAFKVQNCHFITDKYYQPIKALGHGAYGVVCSAIKHNNIDSNNNQQQQQSSQQQQQQQQKVAIKKVTSAFDDLIDAKRILREIKLLSFFNHENIIRLVDLIPPPIDQYFNDIYIVLDSMETDLHKIIYSKNNLTDEHIQYFVYQILCGLYYIHSANVIHRDLKPSNLLLNSNCDLKICDFGLARGIYTDDQQQQDSTYELTEYVVTRWYRAPEIMCSVCEYNTKIDVWSVGCILGEILGRKPLFPGEDYIQQINLIFSILGTPRDSEMKFITNEKAYEYIKNLPQRDKVSWSVLYPNANPLCLDLLEQMLKFDPNQRISVEQAIKHPYFKNLYNPIHLKKHNKLFNFDFEYIELTKQNIQQQIWNEITNYRNDCKYRTFKQESNNHDNKAYNLPVQSQQQQQVIVNDNSNTNANTNGKVNSNIAG